MKFATTALATALLLSSASAYTTFSSDGSLHPLVRRAIIEEVLESSLYRRTPKGGTGGAAGGAPPAASAPHPTNPDIQQTSAGTHFNNQQGQREQRLDSNAVPDHAAS